MPPNSLPFILTAYRREQKGKKEASEQKKKDKDKKTDSEEQDKSRDEDNDEDEERLEEEEQNEEEEVDNWEDGETQLGRYHSETPYTFVWSIFVLGRVVLGRRSK